MNNHTPTDDDFATILMNPKDWKVSKTNLFNFLVMLIAFLELFADLPNLNENTATILLLGVGLLNIILRTWFTSLPVQPPFGMHAAATPVTDEKAPTRPENDN